MAKIRRRTWKNKSGVHSCWEITYIIDGKQYRKSGYESELDAQIDLPNVIVDKNTNTRFEVLSKSYIDRHCELSCKRSTKLLYENYIKVHLTDFKRKIAKEIRKRDFENLVLELKNKELSHKTINDIISLVISILNYGVDSGYLTTNPVPKFKKLAQTKQTINFLNDMQQEVFLNEAKNCPETYYAFFYTALKTGMRRGELLALEWPDIDFKTGRIRVNKQIYRGVTQTTKTGKGRYVDMPSSLIEILKEHKQQGISKYVFNTRGKPLHPYNMEETYFKPLLKRCNEHLPLDNQITKLRFHDLRHSYATYLLSKGVPVKYVQEQLGHSTCRMTLDTYASVMPSVKYGALELLDNIEKNTQIEHKLSTKN